MAPPTATAGLGLRERKKQRTRQTIIDVGLGLFAAQGYAETTLVEIAATADIAPSTFFNYFPSKLDIVFAPLDVVIESARERVLDRDQGESATDAVVAWVSGELTAVERPYSEAWRLIPRIVGSDPELEAANRLRFARLEDTFAEAYARDLDESAANVRPRMMAAIVVWGMFEVWELWYERHAADPDFDLSGVLALKAEYLGPALSAGLEAIASVPAPRV